MKANTYIDKDNKLCFENCFNEGCNGKISETFIDDNGENWYYCDKCGEEYWECPNCGELMNWDWLGNSELAIHDGICKNCMHDGYGC